MTAPAKFILRALSVQECERLRRIAPWFDVVVGGQPDHPEGGLDVFSPAMREPLHFADWQRGHQRLLAEVCAQVLRWIPFHEGEHCAVTLFRHTDARLARVGELYRTWRDSTAQPGEGATPAPPVTARLARRITPVEHAAH